MSGYPICKDAWASEKASCVAWCLGKARDLLANRRSLSTDELQHVDFLVGSAIFDASKVLAFVTGSDWCLADAREIQEHGYAGYERVAVKYGLMSQTEEAAYQEDQSNKLSRFADSLSKLLAGDRSPNRTFIHDLLGNTTLQHPLVEKTAKIVELVTQGILDWKDFCHIVNAELLELNSATPQSQSCQENLGAAEESRRNW